MSYLPTELECSTQTQFIKTTDTEFINIIALNLRKLYFIPNLLPPLQPPTEIYERLV